MVDKPIFISILITITSILGPNPYNTSFPFPKLSFIPTLPFH